MFRRMLLAFGLVAAVGLAGARGDQIIVNFSDAGWYDSTGFHDAGNKNYIVGIASGGTLHHNYFVFNLTGITGTITSAQLRAFNPVGGAGGPDRTFTLFDVSTAVATLSATNSGQVGIYTDLASGTNLGSVGGPYADGGYVTTSLNGSGLAYVNAGLGGQLAFGGDYVGAAGPPPNRLFGFSAAAGTDIQLILERVQAVPAPAGISLVVLGALCVGGGTWLRRRKAQLMA